MKHILEELVDLEYDIKDTSKKLLDRIEYIQDQIKIIIEDQIKNKNGIQNNSDS